MIGSALLASGLLWLGLAQLAPELHFLAYLCILFGALGEMYVDRLALAMARAEVVLKKELERDRKDV